jgi:class 3 adenylate cyclase
MRFDSVGKRSSVCSDAAASAWDGDTAVHRHRGVDAAVARAGPRPYGETLREHQRLLREVWERHRGYEVDTEGDAFFVAFAQASNPFALGERIAKATGSTSPVRHSP